MLSRLAIFFKLVKTCRTGLEKLMAFFGHGRMQFFAKILHTGVKLGLLFFGSFIDRQQGKNKKSLLLLLNQTSNYNYGVLWGFERLFGPEKLCHKEDV